MLSLHLSRVTRELNRGVSFAIQSDGGCVDGADAAAAVSLVCHNDGGTWQADVLDYKVVFVDEAVFAYHAKCLAIRLALEIASDKARASQNLLNAHVEYPT